MPADTIITALAASNRNDFMARPVGMTRIIASGRSTVKKDHLAGGASRKLTALLLPRILPVCSVVAPCHPGAALRDLVPLHRGQTTRPGPDAPLDRSPPTLADRIVTGAMPLDELTPGCGRRSCSLDRDEPPQLVDPVLHEH